MKHTHYFQDSNLYDFMRDMEAVPIISKIELTADCQLQCPGCPTGEIVPDGKRSMSLDLLRRIVDENMLRSTPYVELMISGEGTLHPRFGECVDIVKSSGVLVGISTNLVDRRKIKDLAKLDSVTVSMDVFDKEGYEKSRPPMKFERLVSNIEELVATCPESTMIYLQLLRTPFTEPYFKKSLEDAVRFVEGLNKKNVVLRYVSDCFGEVMGRNKPDTYSKQCLTPSVACVIKWDGKVMPCGYCFTGEEKGMLLGDLNENTLEEIWMSDAAVALREAHRKQENLPERCRLCADKNRNNHLFQMNIAVDIMRHRNGIRIV